MSAAIKVSKFDDGVVYGMALAASLVVRTFDNPTIALEILGAAGIDRKSEVTALCMSSYDAEPLLKILSK